MKYLLQAKVFELSEPVEIEAGSLEEAQEKLIDDVDSGIIEIEPSQSLNVEVIAVCTGTKYGFHRWEHSPHEDATFCKYCGILETDCLIRTD